MNYVTRFLSKLDGVRPTESGDRWRALCPSHNDSNPSLEVAVGEEGGILLKCWSGCSSKKILKALDLEFHHLYPAPGEQVYAGSAKSLPPSSAKKQVAKFHEIYGDFINHLGLREEDIKALEGRGLPEGIINVSGYASLRWFDAVKIMNGVLTQKYGKDRLLLVPGFVWEARYGRFDPAVKEGLLIPVRNLEGHIVGLKVRTGGNPKYRWFSGNGSPSVGNPYHVVAGYGKVKEGVDLTITEGPLKAEVIARHRPTWDVVGISGVDSWKTVLPLIERIKPKGIYLAFDRDWETNSSVAGALGDFLDELRRRDVPTYVARWPEELGKGLDDALKAGGSDFEPEWVESKYVNPSLVKAASQNDIGINHTRHQSVPVTSGTDVSGLSPIRLTRGSEVVVKSTLWLWPGRIPYGAITLVEGDPGVGKSFFLCDLAARVSKGTRLPMSDLATLASSVIYVSSEDPKDEVLMPRFLAAGGSADNIYFLDGIEKDGQDVPLSIPEDLSELRRVITQRGASLVVFDPLTAFLSEKVDSHKDTNVRRALTPLHKLAEETGTAIVGVRHFRKDGTGKAIHRGGGSIGFTAQARSVLLVTRDPEDDERRVLAHSKCNLGPLQQTLAYTLDEEGEGTRVYWDKSYVHMTADEIVSAVPRSQPARDRAYVWLSSLLDLGPQPAVEVFELAAREGHSEKTLKRAKKALGVVTTQVHDESGRRHVWSLPKGE